jgi:hypothetical protein
MPMIFIFALKVFCRLELLEAVQTLHFLNATKLPPRENTAYPDTRMYCATSLVDPFTLHWLNTNNLAVLDDCD